MTPDDALALLVKSLGGDALLSADDIKAQVAAGRGQIWTGEKSAIFTLIEDLSTGERVCSVGPAGGDLQEILAMMAPLEAWAKAIGCTQTIVYAGREGWGRVLREHGFAHFQTAYRKVLV